MASAYPIPSVDQGDLAALIPQMRAFARFQVGDRRRADDLVQDALTGARRQLKAYTPGVSLKAWVFKILRERFQAEAPEPAPLSFRQLSRSEPPPASASPLVKADETDDILRAVHLLPTLHREALTLVAMAGLSQREAALVCDCAEETIESRVASAWSALVDQDGLAVAPRLEIGPMRSAQGSAAME